MSLTGPQRQQLQSALLAAFDEDGLRRLVTFELSEDLNVMIGKGALNQRVFDLVAWADKSGKVSELITGACRQNPNNPELQALAEAAKTWHIEAPAVPEAGSPYKGLAFYDVSDAPLFFGREGLTADLVAYLKEHRFLAVVGASGSGKSSVVRAGVVAALKNGAIAGSDKWASYIVTPTARPLLTLAAALTHDSESVTATTKLIDDMTKDSRSLDVFAARLVNKSKTPRLLLVIDQFEELFTQCKDAGERKSFIDNLLTAAAPDGVTTVVLTLRADFYAHCGEFENLRVALARDQIYIGAMSPKELRVAIENPARQGGWDMEPGLTNRMLKDMAGESGALPLLSHALNETWNRRSDRMMTLQGYEAAGGVQGAIAHTADTLYGQLSPVEKATARNVLVRLTELGEGVQDTRRRTPMAELASLPDVDTVLQKLEDKRLVTAERESDQATYVDVTHEALIRQWPLLRQWLDDDREGLRVHRRLTEAAEEWVTLKRDPGALLRGVLLAQTAGWASAHVGDLNDQEREFLKASQAQVEAEQQAKEAAQKRDSEQERRSRNLLRVLLAAAIVLLVVMIAASVWVYNSNQILNQANDQLKNSINKVANAEATALAEATEAANAKATAVANAAVAEAKATEAAIARATAEANFTLAQQKLDEQKVEALQSSALEKKAKGDVAGAVADFEAAAASAAAKGTALDVSDAISDVLRTAATHLVQEGEKVLRKAQALNSAGPRQQAIISATGLFSEALALQPPSDTPVYVWIEPGQFLMGSTDEQVALALEQCTHRAGNCVFGDYANEQPQHVVDLDGYWIQRTEVTNAQYKRCIDEGACTAPSDGKWNKAQFARQPVTNVTWEQAKAYAEWVGGRLPTEAEWEKACRGTDASIYPWGNNPPFEERLNYSESGLTGPIDVGSYPPGANGLYDMAGNVTEWTADWYGETYYKDSVERNPTGPAEGDFRMLRGGSYPYGVNYVRCANRDTLGYKGGFNSGGIRVVSPGSVDAIPLRATEWAMLSLTATPIPPMPKLKPTNTPVPPPLTSVLVPSSPDIAEEILIPAGEFQMGSSEREVIAAIARCVELGSSESDCRRWMEPQKPLHTVILRSYYIDKYEVSNFRFQACVDAGGCIPSQESRSYTRDSYYGNPDYADYPVITVDWNQAVAFCTWKGKRLPTEAEWEKAARGTDGRTYPWGDAARDETLANFNNNKGDTTAVGSYPSGASPYEVMDMAGNVWEWVNDWYDGSYYSSSPASNPTGPATGDYRVLRGGSWFSYNGLVRAAYRSGRRPDDSSVDLGFRCVRSQ